MVLVRIESLQGIEQRRLLYKKDRVGRNVPVEEKDEVQSGICNNGGSFGREWEDLT